MSTQEARRRREDEEYQRAVKARDEILEALTDPEYSVYAGYYQGLAWQQGGVGGPLKVSKPLELIRREIDDEDDEKDAYPTSFDPLRFFAVVADLDDEGYIHHWEIDGEGGWWLWCTEDVTIREDPIPGFAHHALWWVGELAEQRSYGL